jgi:site-specific DNA recombinase
VPPIEGQFEQMIARLEPTPSMLKIVKAMFTDAWELQRHQAIQTADAFKRGLAKADEEIHKLLDRVVSATNETVVAAYERRIDALEREKLVLAARHNATAKPIRPFDEVFELAIAFVSNPSNLWKSHRVEERRTAIKLAFPHPLTYCRVEGFRTPKASNVFKVVEAMRAGVCRMAERAGFEPAVEFPLHTLSKRAP